MPSVSQFISRSGPILLEYMGPNCLPRLSADSNCSHEEAVELVCHTTLGLNETILLPAVSTRIQVKIWSINQLLQYITEAHLDIYWAPLPTQLYFSSHSLNLQIIRKLLSDYHLNDPTIFLHYHTQVSSAHARILVLGCKKHFPCYMCTVLRFFKTIYTFNILKGHMVSVCKLKCLNLLRKAKNRHWFLVPVNWSFFPPWPFRTVIPASGALLFAFSYGTWKITPPHENNRASMPQNLFSGFPIKRDSTQSPQPQTS